MALNGSLRELRIGDVLQTVLSAGGRGLLRVRNGGRRALLHLGEGGLRLLEPEVLDERIIVEAFVRRGAVAAETVARAKRLAEAARGNVLETLLIGGTIDRQQFETILAEAAEDAILDVFSWTDGDFRFDEGAEPPPARGRVAQVSLEPFGLLLRVAQRTDEQRTIAEQIGSHAVLIIPTQAGPAPADGSMEARVVGGLDGERLLNEISVEDGLPFFETRKAAAALVVAGAARLPTAAELTKLARAREASGDINSAAELLRQWQGQSPQDEAPYEACIDLAVRAGRLDDEAEALRALGRMALDSAKPQSARTAFERLSSKRPGDRDALEGLREAAKALGDAEGFAKTTQDLAAAAMEAGDPGRAAALLSELVDVRPDDVETRLLRVKALGRAGDRAAAIEEFERIADALPIKAKRRRDREIATYCRDTLAHLAPDRSDLLRHFRAMYDDAGRGHKKLLIGVSLLLVLSGIGFVLYPKAPSRLLSRAKDAAANGDTTTAIALLDEIQADYAGSDEADEANVLRRKILPPKPNLDPSNDANLRANVKSAALAARDGLSKWPDPDAVSALEALAERLREAGPNATQLRAEVAELLRGRFTDAVAALRRDAVGRRDALDAAQAAADRPPSTEVAARVLLERARAALDPEWAPAAHRVVTAARKLVTMLGSAWASRETEDDLRFVETDIYAAARAVASRPTDVTRLAREHHRLRIEEASDRARLEGGRALSRGDLDAAEACFLELSQLIAEIEKDPDLRPLLVAVERRGHTELARTKSTMIAKIREGLRAAAEAERTGNLRGAATQYAKLVRQFPEVHFESVFTVPLRIVSVPSNASVALNGRPVPRSDDGTTVVRYGWGATATVSVESQGFEPASVVVETSADRPEAEIYVHLVPKRTWVVPLGGTVESPLIGIDGDVIVCSRSGRIERLSKLDGAVVWSVETRCVEGMRGRPVISGDTLWAPLLDGHAARVALATGGALPPLELRDRPIGDAAALPGRVAFAVGDSVAVFSDSEKPSYVSLPAQATAGVLAALGAFWVGDAAGNVTRIDGASLTSRSVKLPSHAALVGLVADTERVYALTEDGTLSAVAGSAPNDITWSRQGLGDVIGRPAPAPGGVVAVADRAGRVQFLSTKDGTPRAVREMGAAPRCGVTAVGDRIVAALADGRVWVYSIKKDAVLIDASLDGTARLAPTDLGDGCVALPAAGNSVAVIPLPK